MALGTEFPVISTGNLFTTVDTYASTITTQPPVNCPSWPNGAQNPIGAAFLMSPGAPEGQTILYGGNGFGAPLIVRYVRYVSATGAAWLAYPAPVYWTDETYTTVSGTMSEGLGGNLNSLAGWALPNTTSYPGSKTGAQLNTIINGNFIFIATKGFLSGAAVVASTAIGDALIGATGNFVVTRTASGGAPLSSRNAIALTAVSTAVTSDIWINCDPTF